jgi:hypothetical protein
VPGPEFNKGLDDHEHKISFMYTDGIRPANVGSTPISDAHASLGLSKATIERKMVMRRIAQARKAAKGDTVRFNCSIGNMQ